MSDSGLLMRANGRFELKWFKTVDGLPDHCGDHLLGDVRRLERVQTEIEMNDDVFQLKDALTRKGNPVSSRSRELIAAIAFEKAVRGDLDTISLHSVYQTWRDTVADTDAMFKFIDTIWLSCWDGPEASEMRDAVDHPIVSRKRFSASDKERFAEVMMGLTTIQQAQWLSLMDALKSSRSALKILLGAITVEEYVCEFDEWDMKTHVMGAACVVDLFGRLAEVEGDSFRALRSSS